jgi:hypothetical protein
MTPLRYDVVVVGAGPAGASAAVAAARAGARVLLIDSGDRLGGSVTAAMHRCLCGLYATAPENAAQTLNAGVQRELVQRMQHKSPAEVVPRQFGQAAVLEFPPAAWESSLAEISADAGVELRTGTRATAVHRQQRRIFSLELAGGIDGRVQSGAVIDCTGGGSILQLSGEDCMQPLDPPNTEMLGGYAIRWGGLGSDIELLRLRIPYEMNRAVASSELPDHARFAVFYPGPGKGEGVLKLAISPTEFSPDRVQSFVEATIQTLRREIPAMQSATIVESSPRAMRRDGRRLLGKYLVTEQDVLAGKKHGPEAVHACWPIETWDSQTGPSYRYPPPGDYYDIPPDALRCAAIDNLFAAGTCLSATRVAAASTRVGGICLATGAKAGEFAAEQIEN